MTDNEIRIAIAEACGWKQIKSVEKVMHWPGGMLDTEVTRWTPKTVKWSGKQLPVGGVFEENELPDYLNDLNAMHEAEKGLETKGWFDSYLKQLKLICGYELKEQVHATARQRAEAFLITIGKWKEEK